MRRNNTLDTRDPKYTIGIICEGEKSEPYFVSSLYELCKESLHKNLSLDIHPQPKREIPYEENASGRKTGIKDAKRSTKPEKDTLIAKYESSGIPLKWVFAGEEKMTSCNEVWVFFDRDGHPKQPESFAEVDRFRKTNPHFSLIFSSRCFEHYMLLHHELNYTAFEKAECTKKEKTKKGKSKTVFLGCATSNSLPGACQGDKCINGYARLNGYWTESKNDKVFDACKNLWAGILNCWHVKWKSIFNNCLPEVYDPIRTPYLNDYRFTLRMMEMTSLEPFENYDIAMSTVKSEVHRMRRCDNTLYFENLSPLPFKKPVTIHIYRLPTDKEQNNNPDNKLLTVSKNSIAVNLMNNTTIDLTKYIHGNDEYAILQWDDIDYFVALLPDGVSELQPSEYRKFILSTIDKSMLK